MARCERGASHGGTKPWNARRVAQTAYTIRNGHPALSGSDVPDRTLRSRHNRGQ